MFLSRVFSFLLELKVSPKLLKSFLGRMMDNCIGIFESNFIRADKWGGTTHVCLLAFQPLKSHTNGGQNCAYYSSVIMVGNIGIFRKQLN